MVFGYIRISSKEQNEDRQVIAMSKHNIPPQNIFIDKQSGKNFNRPEYKRMIKKLKKGDLLYVKSIDRFGRDYEEIIKQWRFLTKEKKIDIVILDMPLLNTTISKDLLGTFIADLVLQLLSYMAQYEREITHQRQSEGISAARKKGIKFGRPKKTVPKEFFILKKEWQNQKISSREAAKQLGISHQTFIRWCKEK